MNNKSIHYLKIMNILIKKIYHLVSKFIKFKYMSLEEEEKYLLYEESSTYEDIDVSQIDEEERQHWDFIKSWKTDSYIMFYPLKCYIDPVYGWIIAENTKLMLHSVPCSYNKIKHNSTWGNVPKSDKILYLRKKSKAQKLNSVISLNEMGGGFGKNYFFLWDALFGELAMLEQHGIDIYSMPIIIPKEIYETAFFQQAIKLSDKFNNINWIVRDSNFIECQRVYTCKVIHYRAKYLTTVIGWFNNIISNRNRITKVFLKRAQRASRHIENEDEVENIAQKYGFAIIDNEQMSVIEQIKLYRNITHLIAIHGAGITNIIFRYPQRLSLLELHTISNVPASYMILSNQLGYRYNAMIGSELIGNNNNLWSETSSFYLDPTEFENKVKKLIKE